MPGKPEYELMRTFGIWFFGLIASGIGGCLIGYSFSMTDGWLYGAIGGMAAFACGRLWSTAPSEPS